MVEVKFKVLRLGCNFVVKGLPGMDRALCLMPTVGVGVRKRTEKG